jgi:lysophospholipase L1-like esterase
MSQDMAPWLMQNRGVNGAYIHDVAARLSVEKVVSPPGTVIVYIGENDIADGMAGRVAALQVYGMVRSIRKGNPAAHIIVLGMKPSPARWAMRPEQLRFNRRIMELIRPLRNTAFADFGDKLLIDGVPGPYYDKAGIHLNREGYRLWARETLRIVETTLPRAQVDRCLGAAMVMSG